MTRAHIDRAALMILRALLADLERGAAVVVSLSAEDDAERALAVRWREAGDGAEEAPPEPSSAPRAPEPMPATPAEPMAARCRQCGHAPLWRGQHGDVCPECGSLGA